MDKTNNANNVSTAKPKIGGAIFRAATNATLPTDAKTELDTAFKGMGYISDGGVTNSNTRSSGEVKDWGGDVVYNYQTEKKDTFKMTFIESTNVEVLKTVHGDGNVAGDLDTGITIKVNGDSLEPAAWVIDMILRDGVLKRIVIPDGKVTEVGDTTYAGESAISYEVTIAATPDKDGNTHYEYISKPDADKEE